jgi:legumain
MIVPRLSKRESEGARLALASAAVATGLSRSCTGSPPPSCRPQADAFHAYRLLLAGGLRPQRVVLMAADDVATAPQNPSPGRVYNRPGGEDVHPGRGAIDYRGTAVNARNFLAVLRGDAAAVAGVGSGRVIASGPDDRVFVYYTDHGAPGVLGMPSGALSAPPSSLLAAPTHKVSQSAEHNERRRCAPPPPPCCRGAPAQAPSCLPTSC